jgi:hypothetical protein
MKFFNDTSVVRLAALMLAMGVSVWGWLEVSLRMLPEPKLAPVARAYDPPQIMDEQPPVATLAGLATDETGPAMR